VIVLGFDTSTRSSAVGLRLADGSALYARDDPPEGVHPGHATRLLGMAAQLLAGAGVAWSQLDRIGVGLGPGRFTGLRVGVATARGLAQSLSAELVGVPTLRALAEPALAAGEGRPGVLAVIDALRGEVFAAGFVGAGEHVACELEAPLAISPRDLRELAGQAERDGGSWCAVGDGAVRYRAELEAAGASVPGDGSPLHGVDARAICAIAASAPPAQTYEEVVPDYRRRPDAEGVRGARSASMPVSDLQGASR
jgi:tRNA threonylcarbamoyladenosine biosynthesis protein TsaB